MWFYLFALTLCLRLLYITETSIWLDEGYSLYFSQISPFEIIRNAPLDSNPPLGNVLFHYLYRVLGGQICYLRMFGAIASSVTSIVLFSLGSKLGNQKIACYVVLLKAVSSYDIGYATQLRVYPYAELALTTFWLGVTSIVTSERADRVTQFWTAVSAALAIHLHYFCVVLVGCSILALLFTTTPAQQLKKLLWCILVSILLSSPLIWPLYLQVFVHRSYAWIPPASLATLYTTLFFFSSCSFIGTVFFLVLVYSSLVLPTSPHNRPALLCHPTLSLFAVIPIIVVPTSCFFAAHVGIQVMHPRYMFFLFTPFLFLIVLGLLPFGRIARYSLMLLLCCILSKPTMSSVIYSITARSETTSTTPPSSSTTSVHLNKVTYILHGAKHRFPKHIRLMEDGATSNIFKFPTLGESPLISIEALHTLDQFLLYVESSQNAPSDKLILSQLLLRLSSHNCKSDGEIVEELLSDTKVEVLTCYRNITT